MLAWSLPAFAACPAGTVDISSEFPDTVEVCVLDPDTILQGARYTNELPVIQDLGLRLDLTAGSGGVVKGQMKPTTQDLGVNRANGNPQTNTKVWGYQFILPDGTPFTSVPTYPGATIVAKKNKMVKIKWQNKLINGGSPLPHPFPVDKSIHWAFQGTGLKLNVDGVPTVTHLHGGHTESDSDGLPEAWFTPNFVEVGDTFVKQNYRYHNDQEAGTLWYHDHALGITRLNVYAGLAGFYLLRDNNEQGFINNDNLPSGDYEIEIVIQDRMFKRNGQLFYPSNIDATDFPGMPPNPNKSVLAEFFGNFILVNGKAWPQLDVQPRQYRLRILNGSDSRFYNLFFEQEDETLRKPKFKQIGTDDGFMLNPVNRGQLRIGPGERLDVVVNFKNFKDQRLVLRNDAATPFPDGDPTCTGLPAIDHPDCTGDVDPASEIMAFDVGASPTIDPVQLPATLRNAAFTVGGNVQETRQLLLLEGEDQYGRLKPLLGTVEDGELDWFDPITENPMLDDTEIWEIFNISEDAHPIHLHLVAFEIIDRQRINPNTLARKGKPKFPPAWEEGPKDTAIMFPGEVTRVKAKFDRPGATSGTATSSPTRTTR